MKIKITLSVLAICNAMQVAWCWILTSSFIYVIKQRLIHAFHFDDAQQKILDKHLNELSQTISYGALLGVLGLICALILLMRVHAQPQFDKIEP